MINPEIKQAETIGYIKRPETTRVRYAFFTVVYEVDGKRFTAALDKRRKIIAFVLYTGDKPIVKLDFQIKRIGDPAFIVFKNKEEIICGSITEENFVQKMKNVMKNFSHEEYLLKSKLEEILQQKTTA